MYKVIQQGFCYAFGKFVDKKSKFMWYKIPAYCLYAEVGIHKLLIDTGYSNNFFEATNKFPYNLMRYITPVQKDITDIKENFINNKIILDENVKILITHLHPDHIGSLKSLSQNDIYISEMEYSIFSKLSPFFQLKRAYLPDLLPKSFNYRSIESSNKSSNYTNYFDEVYDIFGDESVYAVSLFGHSPNEYGFLIPKLNILYVGDAIYTFRNLSEDSKFTSLLSLIAYDKIKAKKSFFQLKKFHNDYKEIKIITSHDIYMEYSND